MKNWNNKEVICINSTTGQQVNIGDEVTTFRGKKRIVKSFEPPHKPSANGRIYSYCPSNDDEKPFVNGYYASVFGCEYVEVDPLPRPEMGNSIHLEI